MDQVNQAITIATKAHAGQLRKYCQQPYIFHPLRVMLRAAERYGTEADADVLSAAVCHDVLEDCPDIGPHDLIYTIGPRAFGMVSELTNPSKGSKEPRAVRKQMDRDHLATVVDRIPRDDARWVHRIKMLDRIDNLQSLVHCPEWKFLRTYADESDLLLRVIGDADLSLAIELDNEIASVRSMANEFCRQAATRA